MESCLVTYIVHWLFIDIGNRYILYKKNLGFVPGIIILFIFAFVGSSLTYFVAVKVPFIGKLFGIDSSNI